MVFILQILTVHWCFIIGKMWLYQLCTEIGTFRVASPENDLFSSVVSLEFYERGCTQFYGNL